MAPPFKIYPKKTLKLLRENRNKPMSEIMQITGLTKNQVSKLKTQNGWQKHKIIRWTDEQKKYIREHYKNQSDIELAHNLNLYHRDKSKKKFNAIRVGSKMKAMNLVRTKEQTKTVKKRNFQIGLSMYSRRNKGWHTGKKVAYKAIRKDNKAVRKYLVKTKEGWKSLLRTLWEDEHGPVPPKYNVFLKPNHRGLSAKGIKVHHLDCKPRNSSGLEGKRGPSDLEIATKLAGKNKSMIPVLMEMPEVLQLERHIIKATKKILKHGQRKKLPQSA